MKDYVIEVDNRIAAVILACVATVTAAALFVHLTGQQFWL